MTKGREAEADPQEISREQRVVDIDLPSMCGIGWVVPTIAINTRTRPFSDRMEPESSAIAYQTGGQRLRIPKQLLPFTNLPPYGLTHDWLAFRKCGEVV